MLPRVTKVEPLPDHKLRLEFTDKSVGVFDVGPYLDTGVFKELKDNNYFKAVSCESGTVVWKNGQDICPDTLFLECKKESSGRQ